jgi:hypothetical protein
MLDPSFAWGVIVNRATREDSFAVGKYLDRNVPAKKVNTATPHGSHERNVCGLPGLWEVIRCAYAGDRWREHAHPSNNSDQSRDTPITEA